MLYYPQLASGAVSQYPVQRQIQQRTITNEMLGGDNIKAADAAASAVRWRLEYRGLTDAEWSSIAQLFETAEGQLSTFTFLDPTDNLLVWSEDWTQKAWSADPLLTLASCQDPLGGNDAIQLTNSAQATQRLMQTIAGPSCFQYCFSVFLRSDAAGQVQLVVSTSGEELLTPVSVGTSWSRSFASGQLSAIEDGVSFGIQVPAGLRVYGFAAQAEAQRAAGSYKKTIDRGGLYRSTRFDDDTLSRTSDGPNQNSCVVVLTSTLP
jgi:hypothetical protein